MAHNSTDDIFISLKELIKDLQVALPPKTNESLHLRMDRALIELNNLDQTIGEQEVMVHAGEDWAATPFCSPQRTKKKSEQTLISESMVKSFDNCDDSVVPRLKQLATESFKAKDYATALKLCTEAISIQPQESTHHANRSLAHLRLGNVKNAIVDAHEAIHLNPDWGKGHFRLGMAFKACEDFVRAAQCLQTALEKDPKDCAIAKKELKEIIDQQGEKEVKETAIKAVKEAAEKEAKEKAIKAAKEAAEKEATEKAIKALKEAAEKEAKENALKAAKEAAEKEAKENAIKAAKEAAEKEAREKSIEKEFGTQELKKKSNQKKKGNKRQQQVPAHIQEEDQVPETTNSVVPSSSSSSSFQQDIEGVVEPGQMEKTSVSSLEEPLDIVPAIQLCLQLGARNQLTDDFVATKFKGLDEKWTKVAQQLMGSAVQHADGETGELPAKILANMHRFITLTSRKRQEEEAALKGQGTPSSASSFSRGSNGSSSSSGGGGGGEAFESNPTSSRAVEHTPTFLRESLKDNDEDNEEEDLVVTMLDEETATNLVHLNQPVVTPLAEHNSNKTGGGTGKKKKNKNDENPRKGVKDIQKRISLAANGLAVGLLEKGSAVCDEFLAPELVHEVREEISRLEPHYKNSEIWVGKDSDIGAQITVPRVRGDKILWVDSESIAHSKMQATTKLMESLDRLVLHELKLKVPCLKRIKDRTDPMLAIYPGGGSRFQRHIDNTARDGRILTVLCYLNETWDDSNGGFLRIHPKEGERVMGAVDVMPAAGRVAMFFANTIPHEVMPAHAVRHSVTLWYYDADERAEAIERAGPTTGDAGNASLLKAKMRSRQEGRAFLLWILGTDKIATQEAVEIIAQRALKLSTEAVRIVAGVVGAPSPEDFMEALARLTPETLQKLRADLNEMGLDK